MHGSLAHTKWATFLRRPPPLRADLVKNQRRFAIVSLVACLALALVPRGGRPPEHPSPSQGGGFPALSVEAPSSPPAT